MEPLYANVEHRSIWPIQCRAVASVRKIISNAKSWCSDTLVHGHRLKKKKKISKCLCKWFIGCALFQTTADGKSPSFLTVLSDLAAEKKRQFVLSLFSLWSLFTVTSGLVSEEITHISIQSRVQIWKLVFFLIELDKNVVMIISQTVFIVQSFSGSPDGFKRHFIFCEASLLWDQRISSLMLYKPQLEGIPDRVTMGTDDQFYFPTVTRESMSHDAWCQCWTLKWPANCRGWQSGFLLLLRHIHAKPEGQHCPLRCLLCLLHLLLSRVTALTFRLDRKFKQIGTQGSQTWLKADIKTN